MGPISLWGPTETIETSIEKGYSVTHDDIRFLLDHATHNFKSSLTNSKIISLRCGLRPLAVPTSFEENCYPLDISRHHKIVKDTTLPWISVYGGKISGCISMSQHVAKIISKTIPLTTKKQFSPKRENTDIPLVSFPGLHEKVTAIDWCVSNEFCCTLEDYLRRRTNISQWTHREGLGLLDDNAEYIKKLATRLPVYAENNSESYFQQYTKTVHRNFDLLMDQL